MARRKRLDIALDSVSPELETKSAFLPMKMMPIAEVAGETAARAALEEVAGEMTRAEEEGRVVRRLALGLLDVHHLSRDRMQVEGEDFEVLKASISDRGQQTPIEVVRLSAGRFGLISGFRRVLALKALGEDSVLALVRRAETAQAAYVAMIEENEVRADISFYERANIAVQAANAGVYPTPARAVKGLFAHAAPAKRSKILKFVTIRETLGKRLQHPAAIPEKLGLALAAAIEADRGVATRIGDALRKTPAADAAAERRVLERALKNPEKAGAGREDIAPGIALEAKAGRAVLSGPGVDAELVERLRGWLASG